MMNTFKWLAATAIFILLSACRTHSQNVELVSSKPGDNLLVSGQLVRSNDPHSYRGKVMFTEKSHAVVTLCYLPGMDASCKRLAVQRIEGITGFPISFRLGGDPIKVFSRPGGYYLLNAAVYMGIGDELYVGDFVDDIWHEIDGPTSKKNINVTGLEHCSSAGAGGACATRRRLE